MSQDVDFPLTHFIGRLLELVEPIGIEIPEAVLQAAELTEYDVSARYPGELEELGQQKYEDALKKALKTFEWVKKIIENEVPD